MDLAASITGIGVIFICIILFVSMGMNNKKKEKSLLQGLISLAEKNNCQITRHDLWEQGLIGINDTNNRVFFIRKIKENETAQQVDLSQIHKGRVTHNSRTVGYKNEQRLVTDQVKLILTYHDKNKRETSFEFYNADYDSLIFKRRTAVSRKMVRLF